MKRIGCWVLMLTLLISMCGCRRNRNEDFLEAAPAPITISDSKEDSQEESKEEADPAEKIDYGNTAMGPETLKPGEQPPINFESAEQVGEDFVTQYEDQDLSAFPKFYNTMGSYLPIAETESDLMKRLQDGGVLVAGYATGLREGHTKGTYTLTNFIVEKVYYGSCSSSIKVEESFVVKSENGCNYVDYFGLDYSMLKNNQPVLLCLAKTKKEGVYWPVYFEIPLPADYQSYDETYLTAFLDFYRGKRSVYEYSEQRVEKITKSNPDGTVSDVYIEYGGNYWPEREISNEALIEEMSEHILVRLVTEYQIKIWPYGHKEYAANGLPENAAGLKILSYPPKNQ